MSVRQWRGLPQMISDKELQGLLVLAEEKIKSCAGSIAVSPLALQRLLVELITRREIKK